MRLRSPLRTIRVSENTVELEWDESRDEDIKGYKLYYRLRGGSLIEVQELISGTEYEVVGLFNLIEGANKTFQFHLRAVDKMDNISEPSDILEATLP